MPTNGEFGSIVFSGDDGTDFVKGAMIKARLDGTPGNDDMPGRLEFHTTPDGAQAPVERLRITSDGKIGINQTSPTCQLQIDSGSSGAGTVTHLELNHKGNDTNDAVKLNFARAGSDIGSIVLEKVASNNTTDFIFNTRASNTVSESMRITGAGQLLVNTTSASISSSELFEVKSTGNGFSHFRNNSSTYAPIYIDNEASNGGATLVPIITVTDGGGNRAGLLLNNNSDFSISGQGSVSLATGGTVTNATERLRIHSPGYITKPYQVAFFAHCSIGNHDLDIGDKFQFNSIPSSGNVAVNSNHTTFGGTNVFNTSTNTFTAPVAGLYSFTVQGYYRRTGDPMGPLVPRVNNTEVTNGNNNVMFFANASVTDGDTLSGTVILQLAANDAVTVHRRNHGSGTLRFYGPHSHFCGHLIG